MARIDTFPFRGQIMRLAKDFSNIEEFATFCSGRILGNGPDVEDLGPGFRQSVMLPNGYLVYGGEYVIRTAAGIEKDRTGEVGTVFTIPENVESIPAPMFEDKDCSDNYVGTFSGKDRWTASNLASTAKNATVFKNRAMRKLNENAFHQSIVKALAEKGYPVENLDASDFTALYGYDGKTRYHDSRNLAFAYVEVAINSDVELYMGVTAEQAQAHLNRKALVKG